MLKKRSGIFGFILVFILLSGIATAGVTITQDEITLDAGETGTFCDFFVFATEDGGTYHIETTGEIEELTVNIEPNDFPLDAIDCPEERDERIACKNELCDNGVTDQCQQICIDFQAPLIFDEEKTPVKYEGTIISTTRIGLATITEPMGFLVTVIPAELGIAEFQGAPIYESPSDISKQEPLTVSLYLEFPTVIYLALLIAFGVLLFSITERKKR